jgi:hypothetical protein
MKYAPNVSSSRRKCRKVSGNPFVVISFSLLHSAQSSYLNCFVQAHFTAPSSVRRKLMSAQLNTELKNKYGVRLP